MSVPHTASGADLRQLLVLDEVQRQANVSQRTLGERLGLAASVVNALIRELLDGGHLEVVDRSVRPYPYRLTDDGRQYRRDAARIVAQAVPGAEVVEGEVGDARREWRVSFGTIRGRLRFEPVRNLAAGVREMTEPWEDGEAIRATGR